MQPIIISIVTTSSSTNNHVHVLSLSSVNVMSHCHSVTVICQVFVLYNCIYIQAFHFERDDIALENFGAYFKKASEEERDHAEKLMKFQNQRGGRIVLKDIKVLDNVYCFRCVMLGLLVQK